MGKMSKDIRGGVSLPAPKSRSRESVARNIEIEPQASPSRIDAWNSIQVALSYRSVRYDL